MVAAILCSEGTSWLPNEYSHRNKNLIPPFLDERYAQACRGYEISHPYPYPYSQTFIPRTPNPEFLQFFYSTLPEKKHGADISLLKLLKTSKSKKNKHTCALKCTILAEYVKFRENLHNFIDAWIR